MNPLVKKRHSLGWRELSALVSIYFLWGSTYLAIQIALQGFPPFFMAGIRFILAGAVLYLALRLFWRFPAPTVSQWRSALVVGGFLLVGGNGGITFAEKWVQSSTASLVISTVPIWAALFAGLFGQWPTKLQGVGMLIGFLGVVLLNLHGSLWATPLGASALLVSAASWAFGSVISRYLALSTGLMGSASTMLGGGILLLLTSLLQGEKMGWPPSSSSIYAVIYLTVFGSLLGYCIYMYLLNQTPPSVATSYAYVCPLIAVLLGCGVAHETLTYPMIFAGAAILAGMLFMTSAQKRPLVNRRSFQAELACDTSVTKRLQTVNIANNPDLEVGS